ncbi:MAG: SIMPL domain-containing protein [Candidatus Limnocylindrales bacterium]
MDDALGHSITVPGIGRTSRQPDVADVTVTVDMTAKTAVAAQSGASERAHKVLAALTEAGIAPTDVATRGISLDAVYDYRENEARLTGYRSSQTLGVRVCRIETLGPVIDAVITAGATGIASVSLGLSDPSTAEKEARAAALADARERAQTLARAGDVMLGRLLAVVEGSPSGGAPRPMMRMKAEMMAADTPVAEGSTEVVIQVVASFAIE